MATARVIYHLEEGTWWAESPDVPRWSAAAEDLTELRDLVAESVPFALERDDVEIIEVPSYELVPLLRRSGSKTAGAPSRVLIGTLHGLDISSEPPRAGLENELSVVP